MEISIAQNVAGQIQELLQISCIFFANWFAFVLHFFCILILAIKMDLQFFCIIILIFWGPFFSCICFAFFLQNIFFTVCQKEAAARPHKARLHPASLPCLCTKLHVRSRHKDRHLCLLCLLGAEAGTVQRTPAASPDSGCRGLRPWRWLAAALRGWLAAHGLQAVR